MRWKGDQESWDRKGKRLEGGREREKEREREGHTDRLREGKVRQKEKEKEIIGVERERDNQTGRQTGQDKER